MMNEGIFESSYGAPLKVRRVRFISTVTSIYGSQEQRIGEAVVLGTTDDLAATSPRFSGGRYEDNRVDLVLQLPVVRGRVGAIPQAHGSFSFQVPDGSVANGNQRGMGAVDLQSYRTSASAVARGRYSCVLGGKDNSTYYECGVVAGGYGNAAQSNYATVGGGQTNVANQSCDTVSGGANNQASGGNSTIPGGANNMAGGAYSTACGAFSHTRLNYGAFAHASGAFAVQGDAQTRNHIFRKQLVGAGTVILSANGATDTWQYQASIPTDSTIAFEVLVVARRTDMDGESAAWRVTGCAVNDAGMTALLGTPTVVEISRTPALNASVAAFADNTGDFVGITGTVTDTGKTVRFVAKVSTVEVVG